MTARRTIRIAAIATLTFVFALFIGRAGEWSRVIDSDFIVYGQSGGGGGGGATPSVTKIIPHIAMGNYGSMYATVIQVINPNAQAVTLSANFYTPAGAQSTRTFTTNLPATPSFVGKLENMTVAAGGVLVITGGGANNPFVLDGAVNWARFTSTASLTISSFLETRDGATGQLFSRVGISASPANLKSFVIPRLRNPTTGSDTGFALVNTGSTPASITATLKDGNGTVLAARTLTMASQAQTAHFLASFLSGAGCSPCLGAETGNTTSYQSITFSSTTSSWAALGLGIEGNILAGFPVETIG